MIQIYYNSWQLQCKQPYGAIELGQSCQFRIFAPPETQAIELVVRFEENDEGCHYISMNRADEYSYTTNYTFQQGSGLFFYYFKIDCDRSLDMY